MLQHREIRSKKSELRPMLLRIGSLARDATDDPVSAITGRDPMVDQASEQMAIEVTQAVVSTPDPKAALRPTLITYR
ncbi:hypothetical protein R1flu_006343 [Riccia fluitans]|uniref:Uncharacterized protein n=1 Tax=Riccia fluitans TaxID=41844 RepID=A0ABD1YVQ7_9MARC